MTALARRGPAGDLLELLLPEFEPAQRDRARTVVTFFRLLADDARRGTAGAAGVDLHRAQRAFEREQCSRATAALEALLTHHLRAHRAAQTGETGFSRFGAAAQTAQQAFEVLLERREDAASVLPAPGEGALHVAERVLAALEQGERVPALRVALWRARLTCAREGARAGAAALQAVAAEARATDASVTREALAGACEALLDCGAVLAARAALDEQGARALDDPELRRLAAWARLLCGDRAGARALAAQGAFELAPVPGALVELAQHFDEPLLLGAARPHANPAAGEPGAHASAQADESPLAHAWRTRLGCAALAIFRLEGEGLARAVAADASPGLRARLGAWLAEREAACAQPGELEHGLMVGAGERARHAAGTPLADALGRAIRAVALAPIQTAAGDHAEFVGWLRVECEHHLLPTRARLAEAARAWRLPLLRPAASRAPRASPPEAEVDSGAAPQAALFAELVAELRTKTAQRRWLGFDLRDGHPVLVAHGGAPRHAPVRPEGGGGALERAALSGGPCWFLAPDPRLALCAGSASGLVLPLASEGRVCGLLALESTRRRDFPPELAQRLHERARPFGARLRAAQFRHWHRTTLGQDVHVPAQPADPHGLARDLIAAGRARAAAALSGAAGAGRRLAARRVHFEGPCAGEPLVAFACGALEGDGRAALAAALDESGAGSLALLELERLPRGTQAWLLDELEARGDAARWSATITGSVAARLRDGRLDPDLGQLLLRLEIHVPALCQRREEIAAWAGLFAERSARAEGLRAPSFEDATLAVLWRQAWPGNLPELEGLVHKLVLAAPGRALAPDDLCALARRFRFALVARLPSRRPDPADLLAALRTTRNACGTLNKTRAALYLGWDPDTLVARMQGAGIALDLCFEPVAG